MIHRMLLVIGLLIVALGLGTGFVRVMLPPTSPAPTTNRAAAIALINAEAVKMANYAQAWADVERRVTHLSEVGLQACRDGRVDDSAAATRAALDHSYGGVIRPREQLPRNSAELRARIAPPLWSEFMVTGQLSAYFAAAGNLTDTVSQLAGHERELGQRRASGQCG